MQRTHFEVPDMISIRRANDRGLARFGWLDSRHTFSCGHYHDPRFMGHGPLRVINEDRVNPGAGFGQHGHQDMEIVSYVLAGALEHTDSLGNSSIIRPGDVQRMSAGTGVRHSEHNASATEPVHFLQIWLLPEQAGLAPSYEQRSYGPQEKRGHLRLVGSRDGREGSVTIHQDVLLYAGLLGPGEALAHGDGAAIEGPALLELAGTGDESEVLLFDMADGPINRA